jgi:hypothetical protein
MTKRMSMFMAGIVFAGAAVAVVADARSIPAFAGKPFLGGQTNCFSVDFSSGWLTNNGVCGTSLIIFEIPLPTDNAGGKTVDMTVVSPSVGALDCREVAISRTGTNFTASPFQRPAQFNTPVALPLLTGASLLSKGLLYVDCDVGNGASLIQVDYNQ